MVKVGQQELLLIGCGEDKMSKHRVNAYISAGQWRGHEQILMILIIIIPKWIIRNYRIIFIIMWAYIDWLDFQNMVFIIKK